MNHKISKQGSSVLRKLWPGHSKKFKKTPRNENRKNPLENNETVITPELLLGEGGSLERTIDYIRSKALLYSSYAGYAKGFFDKPASTQQSSLYRDEKIITNKNLEKILNSTLCLDDINDNNGVTLKSGDSKKQKTKDGIIPRNYKRALRKLIHDNELKSECDCCGEHEILPELILYKELGPILNECQKEEIEAIAYCNIWNVLQLCKNCIPMYKLFIRGKINEAPKWKQDRLKHWIKRYGTPQPKAIKENRKDMNGYNGFMIYNRIIPGNSYFVPMNENIKKRLIALGEEELADYEIEESVDE